MVPSLLPEYSCRTQESTHRPSYRKCCLSTGSFMVASSPAACSLQYSDNTTNSILQTKFSSHWQEAYAGALVADKAAQVALFKTLLPSSCDRQHQQLHCWAHSAPHLLRLWVIVQTRHLLQAGQDIPTISQTTRFSMPSCSKSRRDACFRHLYYRGLLASNSKSSDRCKAPQATAWCRRLADNCQLLCNNKIIWLPDLLHLTPRPTDEP